MQELRPQWERDLPQYERDALDRQRSLTIQNKQQNPAIMAEFNEINRKLDLIYAYLIGMK